MTARIFTTLTALVLAASQLHSADYSQPNFAKELFQLDKIPLKVDRMKELSRHLVVMSMRDQDTSPRARRATAQLLAVAARLDPTNKSVREVNQTFSSGSIPAASAAEELQRAKARLRFFNRWLASDDAGKNANLLSAYLTDAAAAIEGKDSAKANWDGIVPSLKAYEGDTMVAKKTANTPPIGETKTPDTTPKVTPPTEPANNGDVSFKIAELSIKSPFVMQRSVKYRDEKDDFKEKKRSVIEPQIISLGIKISPRDKNNSELRISRIASARHHHGDNDPLYKDIRHRVHSAMGKAYSRLPKFRAEVSTGKIEYSRSNKQAMAAPIALMLKASLEGAKLRPDVVIAADMTEDGKLITSPSFWNQLSILRKSQTGGRLIVANDSAKALTQVLVFGEPDFFTRWEVIGVDDLAGAYANARQAGTQEHGRASELFATIQNLAKKDSIAKLTTNRAVRTRLSEVIKLSPNHLSAKSLLLQGSMKRPRSLSTYAHAQELRPVVRAINSTLFSVKSEEPSPSRLRAAHAKARAVLDRLESLVDRDHKELHERVLTHADELRRLSVLSRRISNEDHNTKNKTRNLHKQLVTENAKLTELLDQIIDPDKAKKKDE